MGLRLLNNHAEFMQLFGKLVINTSPQKFAEFAGCSLQDAINLYSYSVAETVFNPDAESADVLAERGEGLSMRLGLEEGVHACFFFPFNEDGTADEAIFINASLELTRFLVEFGFLNSADGKHLLGVTAEPAI